MSENCIIENCPRRAEDDKILCENCRIIYQLGKGDSESRVNNLNYHIRDMEILQSFVDLICNDLNQMVYDNITDTNFPNLNIMNIISSLGIQNQTIQDNDYYQTYYESLRVFLKYVDRTDIYYMILPKSINILKEQIDNMSCMETKDFECILNLMKQMHDLVVADTDDMCFGLESERILLNLLTKDLNTYRRRLQ